MTSTTSGRLEYLTAIASQWADPIADLAGAWRQRVQQVNYPSHLTTRDQGTCYSIILLLVVMLESYSLRAKTGALDATEISRLLKINAFGAKKNVDGKFTATSWWKQSSYSDRESVIDVFMLRDALAHNHLYIYSQVESATDLLTYSRLVGGSKEFDCRATAGYLRVTGLPCIANEIGISEVAKVSEIVRNALIFLKKTYSLLGSVDFNFAGRGDSHNLWECIDDAVRGAKAYRGKTGDNALDG